MVEDDESITLGLQMNLDAEGYRVSVAMDGEQGSPWLVKEASIW